ncbi:MAG: hypothetical protein HY598_03345 [Candidatus Omnitrophica bacterium]|nr:hypothetical protein [Candidatus Omnitrophota bacterium]
MTRSVRWIAAILPTLFIVSSAHQCLLYAEEAPAPATPPADQRMITGEVVDPAAYLRLGQRGVEMEEQTYAAVDGGQSLALLEDGTNTLYLLLAEQAGEDPNELVYDYVNQHVKAVGRVYERGGLKGFVATAVEPVVPAAPATATPAN